MLGATVGAIFSVGEVGELLGEIDGEMLGLVLGGSEDVDVSNQTTEWL